MNPGDPHLPRLAAIEGYGNGGFRFAGMSHRGSLLCLPRGIWAWPVSAPDGINETTLAPVFAQRRDVELFLIGSGVTSWLLPEALRWRFRDSRIGIDVMATGAAVRTYNILLAEGRSIGAGLIAVS